MATPIRFIAIFLCLVLTATICCSLQAAPKNSIPEAKIEAVIPNLKERILVVRGSTLSDGLVAPAIVLGGRSLIVTDFSESHIEATLKEYFVPATYLLEIDPNIERASPVRLPVTVGGNHGYYTVIFDVPTPQYNAIVQLACIEGDNAISMHTPRTANTDPNCDYLTDLFCASQILPRKVPMNSGHSRLGFEQRFSSSEEMYATSAILLCEDLGLPALHDSWAAICTVGTPVNVFACAPFNQVTP